MKLGVVYKFKPQNKINGTLFYCFEYFQQIKQSQPVKFYIVGISDKDLALVQRIFTEKYTATLDDIVQVPKVTDLYKLKLDRTLVLDVLTWQDVRAFLTNEVHVFSNYDHDNFRYKDNRTVTYYGSYPYQRYDNYCILKLNFDIFKPLSKQGTAVFVSALDQQYILRRTEIYRQRFLTTIILKKNFFGTGNLFDDIHHVHYVHTAQDTNNRIIPEALFYNKTVTIDEECYNLPDSIWSRYNDIKENGLVNYRLSNNDAMVEAMIRE